MPTVTLDDEHRDRLDALARAAQKTRREMMEAIIGWYEIEMEHVPPRDFPFTEDQMESLTPRERQVALLRIVGRGSLHYIAKYYGVSQERIRQIEARAFRKMRGD